MPGFDTGPIGFDTGPIQVSTGPLEAVIPALLDPCNARTVQVYVDREKGQIWRIFDPMSPTEKLPVVKEWTDTRKIPIVSPEEWEWVPPQPAQPTPGTPGTPPQVIHVPGGYLCHLMDGSNFEFDKPEKWWNEAIYDTAFTDALPAGPRARIIAEIQAKVNEANARLTPEGRPIPSNIDQFFLVFGHADMTNTFEYNHGLSHRRARAVQRVVERTGTSIRMFSDGRNITAGRIACADFNPCSGPTDHEKAAEDSPSGVATKPAGAELGNVQNRRVELFVLRDYNNKPSEITKLIDTIRGQLKDARGISDAEWPAGTFPCKPAALTSDGGSANTGICKKLLNAPAPNFRNDGLTGEAYRQCEFYKRFKEGLTCIPLEGQDEVTPGTPATPGTQPPDKPGYWKKVKEETVTYKEEVYGEYHPPPGEHYGYYMDEMVKKGVRCAPALPPQVDVAPNDPNNPEDFNLIKSGPIRVVKLDIGFWGDERKRDVSRKAGFRREPARSFGVIEGPFVWLCYFEGPDNKGLKKGCEDAVDPDLNPLMDKFMKAVNAANKDFKVLILCKAVAEAGPPPDKLCIFLPDMHLPRRFEAKDPTYATDECLFRYQMVRSMVLHQLRRDYQLPYLHTPWLSVEDRQLCKEFFEHGAEKLKLPHYSTGRKISNPADPGGGSFLEQATDVAKKTFQLIQQVGSWMFEFTREDLLREVKSYPENFPEAGRGRTKDGLSNWFYGWETDRNVFGPGGPKQESTAESMIPGVVKEVANAWGADLGPDKGQKPAQESYDKVDPGPARDLLRLLKVIQQEKSYIRLFHTGDLYELWVNRRYLYEDFKFTDDPLGRPDMVTGLDESSGEGFWNTVGNIGKLIGKTLLRTLLGGLNSTDSDVWYRREVKKNPPEGQLPEEWSFNLERFPDINLPKFGPGLSMDLGGFENLQFRYVPPFQASREQEQGVAYVSDETSARVNQVLDFRAPIRTDSAGKAEDTDLLGSGNVVGDEGKWSNAIRARLNAAGAKFLYGNHDCFRGLHGGTVAPFHSEDNLWVEHGHRFEDSNLDGQPFGAFVTNLAFDIMELALYEGLLDEFVLHREQSQYQPGIMQWFLLTEFGLDQLPNFRRDDDWPVPSVKKFRIAVSAHTHAPDLIVGEIVFRAREDTSLEFLITDLGAIVKGILMLPALIDWLDKWTKRAGWEKWWEDIKGNTINWGVDFAGLGKCVDKAIDYLKSETAAWRDRLVDQAKQTRDSAKAKAKEIKDGIDRIKRNLP